MTPCCLQLVTTRGICMQHFPNGTAYLLNNRAHTADEIGLHSVVIALTESFWFVDNNSFILDTFNNGPWYLYQEWLTFRYVDMCMNDSIALLSFVYLLLNYDLKCLHFFQRHCRHASFKFIFKAEMMEHNGTFLCAYRNNNCTYDSTWYYHMCYYFCLLLLQQRVDT